MYVASRLIVFGIWVTGIFGLQYFYTKRVRHVNHALWKKLTRFPLRYGSRFENLPNVYFFWWLLKMPQELRSDGVLQALRWAFLAFVLVYPFPALRLLLTIR